MNDILSIIGLSSLIASIVTVILGIVKDILVEKYRFKREKEAGYIQAQIRLYRRIHFLLRRLRMGATISELFGSILENTKTLNDIMSESSDILESRVTNTWVAYLALIQKAYEAKGEKRKKLIMKAKEHEKELISTIKEIMNENLIPKYRKFVGETVPILE